MASNGGAARADSGCGRWGAAEEGIGRSSAGSMGEGWIWGMDEDRPASGGSVEKDEDDSAATAGQKRLKTAFSHHTAVFGGAEIEVRRADWEIAL